LGGGGCGGDGVAVNVAVMGAVGGRRRRALVGCGARHEMRSSAVPHPRQTLSAGLTSYTPAAPRPSPASAASSIVIGLRQGV